MAQAICKPFSLAPRSRATGLARRAPVQARVPARPCRVSSSKPGVFGDAIATWLDLAQFVSGNPDAHTPYDDLAKKIGDEVYMDFNGWHLYLKDVKVAGNVTLAQSLACQLGSGQSDIKDLLFRVPIQVGAGKVTLSLQETLPLPCVEALAHIANDWAAGKK